VLANTVIGSWQCNIMSAPRHLYNCLVEDLNRLLYTPLHPPSGAHEVSREKWQLVTDFHDDCDGLIPCESLTR
jgi:hypothetical protein